MLGYMYKILLFHCGKKISKQQNSTEIALRMTYQVGQFRRSQLYLSEGNERNKSITIKEMIVLRVGNKDS